MPLAKSPQAFKLRTLFMGSLGTIPESHARTVDKKQLAAWIKEGLIAHRSAEKLYPEIHPHHYLGRENFRPPLRRSDFIAASALTPKGEARIR